MCCHFVAVFLSELLHHAGQRCTQSKAVNKVHQNACWHLQLKHQAQHLADMSRKGSRMCAGIHESIQKHLEHVGCQRVLLFSSDLLCHIWSASDMHFLQLTSDYRAHADDSLDLDSLAEPFDFLHDHPHDHQPSNR